MRPAFFASAARIIGDSSAAWLAGYIPRCGDCPRTEISRRLKEARNAERLLDDQGIDYLLEAAPYAARLLFVIPVTRVGVYFYARESEAADVRQSFAASGFTIVEVLDDDEADGDAGESRA